jgi:predicted aspartyl protease
MDSDGFGFVEFFMKPKNSTVLKTVLFKVDCGASISTVKKEDLLDLGWTARNIVLDSGKARIITLASNYRVRCRPFKFPLINFCGTDFTDVDLYYMEGRDDFKNLLGMNILKWFITVIDTDNDEIRIERGTKEHNLLNSGIGDITELGEWNR